MVLVAKSIVRLLCGCVNDGALAGETTDDQRQPRARGLRDRLALDQRTAVIGHLQRVGVREMWNQFGGGIRMGLASARISGFGGSWATSATRTRAAASACIRGLSSIC